MFKNKTLLITGGTGSFGNAVLKRFLDSDIAEIRIFSRDEKNKTICVNVTAAVNSSFILGMCVIIKAY
jgi:FlaA1/EpsC-like NDP-sugar epimerase